MELIRLNKVLSEKDKGEIWLLRHARAPHNRYDGKATFAGARIDNSLTSQGKTQTKKLAQALIEYGPFEKILVSFMKRSRETAQIIKMIFETNGRHIPIQEISNFGEIDVGEFTEKTKSESESYNPAAASKFYKGQLKNLAFPGGETYHDLLVRARQVFRQLKDQTGPGQKIIVVGHGMFNRLLLHELYPDQKKLWQPRRYPHDRVVVIPINRFNRYLEGKS